MKRSNRINFWLGDKDLAQIGRKAKAAGICRSEFIRKLIRKAKIIPAPDVDFSAYAEKFKHLGYVLNEILKEYNAVGVLNNKAANIVWEEIISLAEQLRSELIDKTIDLEVDYHGNKK